jgi:hypothetical protein
MKLRDRARPQGVIDLWMRSVEAEFGSGGHVATLLRLNPIVQKMIETPGQTDDLVEFGYVLGADNCELEFAMRSLELLAEAAGPSVAAVLNTRATAVSVADGWNAGVLDRIQYTHSNMTPVPIFLQLVQQRYLQSNQFSVPASQQVGIVVVDVQHVVGNRLEVARVQRTVTVQLRRVFNAGQPISEGPNGNLVVMVERGPTLLEDVAALSRAIMAEPSLSTHAVRVWIEPLSDDEIHLQSHLESLLGKLG